MSLVYRHPFIHIIVLILVAVLHSTASSYSELLLPRVSHYGNVAVAYCNATGNDDDKVKQIIFDFFFPQRVSVLGFNFFQI